MKEMHRQRRPWRRWLRKAAFSSIASIVSLVVAFPLIWMVLGSFKSRGEIYRVPPSLFPRKLTLEGYRLLAYYTDFPVWFRNSLIVAMTAALLAVVIGGITVYTVTRFRFVGGRAFTYSILFTYMLPPILLVIPFFALWVKLHMADKLSSLVLSYVSFTLPFTLWMLRSYFESIPVDMEESAMVDGATRLQAFRLITIPLALPGIIATFIFTFILAWNEYLFALVLLSSESNKTVSLGIASLIGTKALFSWGMLNAAGVLGTVPVLVFFILVQRWLVAGFTVGALKG